MRSGEGTALTGDDVSSLESTIASPARASLAVVRTGAEFGRVAPRAVTILAGFTGDSYVGGAVLGRVKALGVSPVAVVAEGVGNRGVVVRLEPGRYTLPVAVSVDGSKLGGRCWHRKFLPTAGRTRRVRLHLYYNEESGKVKQYFLQNRVNSIQPLRSSGYLTLTRGGDIVCCYTHTTRKCSSMTVSSS